MPVVVRTRAYDETFYRAMGVRASSGAERRQTYAEVDELFPE
jgi:hypothetical protein